MRTYAIAIFLVFTLTTPHLTAGLRSPAYNRLLSTTYPASHRPPMVSPHDFGSLPEGYKPPSEQEHRSSLLRYHPLGSVPKARAPLSDQHPFSDLEFVLSETTDSHPKLERRRADKYSKRHKSSKVFKHQGRRTPKLRRPVQQPRNRGNHH